MHGAPSGAYERSEPTITQQTPLTDEVIGLWRDGAVLLSWSRRSHSTLWCLRRRSRPNGCPTAVGHRAHIGLPCPRRPIANTKLRCDARLTGDYGLKQA